MDIDIFYVIYQHWTLYYAYQLNMFVYASLIIQIWLSLC